MPDGAEVAIKQRRFGPLCGVQPRLERVITGILSYSIPLIVIAEFGLRPLLPVLVCKYAGLFFDLFEVRRARI